MASFVILNRNPIKKKPARKTVAKRGTGPKRKTVTKAKPVPARKTVARRVAPKETQAAKFIVAATAAQKIVGLSPTDIDSALMKVPGTVRRGKAPLRIYKFADGSCLRLTHKSIKEVPPPK